MSYIEIQPYDGWYDFVIEDFCDNICPHLGLSVNPKDVASSVFWSQGDGASFEGNFYLSDVNLTELKQSLPTAVELHQIAEELAELANEHPEIQGKVTRISSLYSHSNTMIMGEWSSNVSYCDEHTEAFAEADGEDSLLGIFRRLADWLYSRLEDEYDFQLADATARQWADAVEERKELQAELEQLQVDVAANPPSTLVQSNALTSQVENLKDEIESITNTIDQLADQFDYWSDGEPMTVDQFYETNF